MKMVRINLMGTAEITIMLVYSFCIPYQGICLFFASSDDFPESTGVKRIVQALNANVWSSVEMKDGKMHSCVTLSF